MSINRHRLAYLLEQYAEKAATEEEVLELFALMKAANEAEEDAVKIWLNEKLAATEPAATYDYDRWNKVVVNILSPTKLSETEVVSGGMNEVAKPGKISILPVWKRLTAIACVLLLVVSGWYTLFNKPENTKPFVVTQAHDVKPPAGNRATITLSDGQMVYLDSATNGTLAQQGNVNVKKSGDGKISYTSILSASALQAKDATVYNTLTNPRGSKVIDITLSDGSRVWLNAESAVTFPVAFAANERKVTITGEAYFEVAKNARRKFLVNTKEGVIEVLGTHFNVNSYADEVSEKITLLEGMVKVTKGTTSRLLKPGQQAVVEQKVSVLDNVDTDEVMAWRNGKFRFGEKTDISVVMREIARWYDVEIEYKGTITGHIGGGISREVNASKVLQMLEATGIARFKIEGKKVIIYP